jgi:hypothetical protein
MKSRRRFKREKEKKVKKVNISFTKIFLFLLFLTAIGYFGYLYIGFEDIKSEDPLADNNADYYLLSNQKDALEKTLIVFEEQYNEKERIKSAYLYSENKEKGVAVLTYIPNWIEYGGVEEDFGSAISISTFRYAGDFLQEGRGFEYAVWQFEQLLGGNIDNYIWFSSSATQIFTEKLEQSNSSSVYAQYFSNGFDVSEEAFFLNDFVSRLNWFNILTSSSQFKNLQATIYSSYSTVGNTVVQLKQIHKGILEYRPYLIDLSSNQYLVQEATTTGVGVSNYLDVSEYDQVWQDFITGIIDKELEKERVRVEIYNASDLAGYAGQYARRIRNSGCEVVRYDNAPQIQQQTQFYVPNPDDFKNSLETILELFPGDQEIVEGRPSFMTTGDIVIILGEDIPTAYSF